MSLVWYDGNRLYADSFLTNGLTRQTMSKLHELRIECDCTPSSFTTVVGAFASVGNVHAAQNAWKEFQEKAKQLVTIGRFPYFSEEAMEELRALKFDNSCSAIFVPDFRSADANILWEPSGPDTPAEGVFTDRSYRAAIGARIPVVLMNYHMFSQGYVAGESFKSIQDFERIYSEEINIMEPVDVYDPDDTNCSF